MIMNRIFYLLLFTILVSGCATPEPESTPTLTPKPSSCAEVEDPCIEIVFSEDKCTYQGPNTLSPGISYIQFHNQREERARMGLWKLGEGYTIQSFQEFVGEEPSSVHHNPPRISGMGTASVAGPGKMILRKEDYLPGSYVVDCFIEDPYQLWFAGGFTVE